MMRIRKQIIGVASIAFVLTLSAGIANASVTAKADAWSGFEITATSIRLDDPTKEGIDSGLRFKTVVSATATELADAECYTRLTFTSSVDGETKDYSIDVPATVWRSEGGGWNTVLLDIPGSDYTTEVTAQSFIVLNESTTYETQAVSSSIAKTAAASMAAGVATNEQVGIYVNSIVTGVTLDTETATVKIGETQTLAATVSPAGYAVKWTSDNEAVARVENGVVTAVGTGTANITASVGEHTATCAVKVPYASTYDFEDGVVRDMLYWITTGKSQTVSVYTDTDNSYLHLHVGATANPQFAMKLSYLDDVFADSSVASLKFKFCVSASSTAVTNREVNWDSSDTSFYANFQAGVWYDRQISRSLYEAYKATGADIIFTAQNQSGKSGGTVALSFCFDDFEAAPHATEYDFEDGQDCTDIDWINTKSPSRSVVDYNGSKALKLYTAAGAQWPGFNFAMDYLDRFFADEEVTALKFDVTADFTPTTTATQIGLNTNNATYAADIGWVIPNVISTGTITRAGYEAAKAAEAENIGWTFMNQTSNTGAVALSAYIDNITAVKKEPTDPTLIANFDDQQIPDFIQFVASSVTQNKYFVDGKSGEDGDKAFVLQNGATSNPQFYFSGAWLDSVFADENVEAFTYDFSISANGDREISASAANSSLYKKYTNHEWTTITFTRAIYNEWKASGQTDLTFTWQNQAKQEGGCGSVSAIFDNFRYVFKSEE